MGSLETSSLWCLEEREDAAAAAEENARRVFRKAETATSARDGGNHSRVWSKMSGPFTGWRERAKHDIFFQDL